MMEQDICKQEVEHEKIYVINVWNDWDVCLCASDLLISNSNYDFCFAILNTMMQIQRKCSEI